MSDKRKTFTVEEAAEFIGIGRNSAYEAIRRGEIPALRLGRRLVVPKEALGQLLWNGDSGKGGASEIYKGMRRDESTDGSRRQQRHGNQRR